MRNEFVVFLILAMVASVYFLEPSITGFVIGNEGFSDSVNVVVASDGAYEWEPTNKGDLTSIKVSGTLSKKGSAKVYITINETKFLVFDSKIESIEDSENQEIDQIEEVESNNNIDIGTAEPNTEVESSDNRIDTIGTNESNSGLKKTRV